MLVDHVIAPDAEALEAFLRRHLRSDALVQVAAECEVLYHGRAASTADAGDYLLIVKRDGSLQLHGDTGIKPVNWQPQVDDVHLELDDGRLALTAQRFTPPEWVRVTFLAVGFAQAVELTETSGFVLMGTEAEMQRALALEPERIEAGLEVLELELPTPVGGIDLYARDVEGRLVVVELKRGRANQEAVHQLQRYVAAVRDQLDDADVRGILAAPEITGPALERLQGIGLEYRQVTALPTMDDARDEQPSLF